MSLIQSTANVLPFRRRSAPARGTECTPLCVTVGAHRLLVDAERLISSHDQIEARWMPGQPAWATWLMGPFGVVPAIDLRRRLLERDPAWPTAREHVAAVTLTWDWRRVGFVVDRVAGEMQLDARGFAPAQATETWPVRARCVHAGEQVGLLDVEGLLGHPLARRALAQPLPPQAD